MHFVQKKFTQNWVWCKLALKQSQSRVRIAEGISGQNRYKRYRSNRNRNRKGKKHTAGGG